MIPLPLKSTIIEEKKDSIKIQIDGLYPGYGTTLGNSLRRVLISSLSGAAVTEVKIRGIQHEFSTIEGVLEDVISIIMNIKNMRFKLYTDDPQKAIISVKGEKKVKASDFKFPTDLEIVNKDSHIATLTSKNSSLDLEITVEKGVGYQIAEERKEQKKTEIGVIPIDSIFSPVKRVNFRVENMRVKDRTDFERLFIDIILDGTIAPRKALSDSIKILIDHLSLIENSLQEEKEKTKSENIEEEKEKEKKEEEEEKEKEFLKKRIEDLSLSTRTSSSLLKGNIKTISGLVRKSEEDLKNLEGMGNKGIEEIKKFLKKEGFELNNK